MDAWVIDAPKVHLYEELLTIHTLFNSKTYIVAQGNLMACMHGKAK
jgi:hypothetical protein